MADAKGQMSQIWLCCEQGLCDITGRWLPSIPFQGRTVTSGAVTFNRVAVVVDHHEVWQGSQSSWEKLVECELTINDLHYTRSGMLLAATEQGRMACISDNCCIFNRSFGSISSRSNWRTPWGGPPNTHSIVESPSRQLYAGVHMGWLVRSDDDGETWTQVAQNLDIDISDVVLHPQEASTLAVATARGLFVSEDSGNNFEQRWHGLPINYLRTVAIFSDCDVWIVSAHPDAKPDATTALYRSLDRGRTWQIAHGVPTRSIGHINTIQILDNGNALALAYEKVFITNDYGANWQQLSDLLPRRYFDPRRSFLRPILYGTVLSEIIER